MFLPIQDKPTSLYYPNVIFEVPDLISKNLADRLKTYAKDSSGSGWHRRGSKTPNYVDASFYTCLLPRNHADIYDALDPVWEKYRESSSMELTFIELYEIKSYIENDGFGLHNDVLISGTDGMERKANLTIQLSDKDDYQGGDLDIIGVGRCSRKLGTGIFFPAKYLHCVTKVTKGERFSLIGHAWGPIAR